ncbi:hypothetical protein N3K66_000379 [Trichothecium roseum]|uniref:Uncharacterized protein n=1 Tax=Trichothecium roseum TaxID=47278 RepID=A0ACC0VBP6_9HYPO|nr:hypothetical protein N3K66_000379 [Trichothecium roseum]
MAESSHHHHRNRESAAVPAAPTTTSLSQTSSSRLRHAFTTFLTLALHSLLYHRGLYPRSTFLVARALGLPVQQSRHPGVCRWVSDAVAAVSAQLGPAAAERVVFCAHMPGGGGASGGGGDATMPVVVERWVFDVGGLPEWPEVVGSDDDSKLCGEEYSDQEEDDDDDGGGDSGSESASEADSSDERDNANGSATRNRRDKRGPRRQGQQGGGGGGEEDGDGDEEVNWVDVEEGFRGALRRLAYAAEKMPDLPRGSTFSLAIEIKDAASAPIGYPQPWIPAQPSQQRRKGKAKTPPAKGVEVTPVRSIRAGPMFFECWVEERSPDGLDDESSLNATPKATTPNPAQKSTTVEQGTTSSSSSS